MILSFRVETDEGNKRRNRFGLRDNGRLSRGTAFGAGAAIFYFPNADQNHF